jgi:hypothetical protein
MQFPRLEDDGFVERLMMPLVGLADENAEENGFVG